jgi:hypothetical protein
LKSILGHLKGIASYTGLHNHHQSRTFLFGDWEKIGEKCSNKISATKDFISPPEVREVMTLGINE